MRGTCRGLPRSALRKGLLLALLALGGVMALGAAELVVDRLAFLPAAFGAGELTEAIASVHVAEGTEPEAFTLRAGEGLSLPGPGSDPEIREVRLQRGPAGLELHVLFLPWSPGEGALPAFSAHGLMVPRLPYSARAALPAGARDPAPPKPPREPPGAFFALYGLASLVLLLVLIAVALLSWVLPAARAILARRGAAQAWRALSRQLEFLGKGLGQAALDRQAASAFYAALARGFRHYLAARVLVEAPALTPGEFRSLPESRFPAIGLREEAAALLAEADAVRFAGAEARASMMAWTLERALRFGKVVEEALVDRP